MGTPTDDEGEVGFEKKDENTTLLLPGDTVRLLWERKMGGEREMRNISK